MYEYLAARRPILAAVPPNGVAAALVGSAGAGEVADPDDAGARPAALEALVDRRRNGGLPDVELPAGLARADVAARRAGELADVLHGWPDEAHQARLAAAPDALGADVREDPLGDVRPDADAGRTCSRPRSSSSSSSTASAAETRSLHPAAITLAGFMLAFAAVYLAGYFDLQDKAALAYWLKGLGSWGIHFLYLILGVAHLVRRGRPLFVRAIIAFTAGLVVNSVYGILQLGLAVAAGINLDRLVVGPLTAGQGGVGGINVFGTVSGRRTSTGSTRSPATRTTSA